MLLRRSLAASCLLGICLAARAAAASDVEAAKVLFDRGAEAMDAKDYEKACPAFELSYKLDLHPGTLFALADCEALRGRLASAVVRYKDYLALYATLPKDKQKKQGTREKEARDALATLEPQVPVVTLTLVKDAAPGTVVTRDGAPVEAGALGGPMRLDPGEHVFVAQAPGGKPTELKIVLAKGEKRALVLEVAAPPVAGPIAPPPVAPPPDTGPSGRRIGAFVAGGVGAAGLVVGAITGGLMLSKKGAITAGCKDLGDGTESCNSTGAAAGNSAKTLGAVSSAGFVTGLVGLGVGTVLFLTEPKKPAAGLVPRSLAVGALSLGPETTLGVRGSF